MSPALRGALQGRGESALVDHARLQPLGDQSPCGERAQLREQIGVIDPVERRFQVCVERPLPAWVAALAGPKDGLDRIMATTARPKPVRLRLKPRLPLRFQRSQDNRLERSVSQNRNAQRALPPAGLGHPRPLDRPGIPPGLPTLRPVGQLGLGLGQQRRHAVDPGGRAASVDLCDPPHRHQGVRAGAEHQLLQVADLLQVPFPRCREDPLPQTSYVAVDPPPVHGIPVQDVVLRSVRPRHSRDVQLVPWFPRRCHRALHRLTRPTWAPFRAGTPSPVSGQFPRGHRHKERL
jgi:hypothetical protein